MLSQVLISKISYCTYTWSVGGKAYIFFRENVTTARQISFDLVEVYKAITASRGQIEKLDWTLDWSLDRLLELFKH